MGSLLFANETVHEALEQRQRDAIAYAASQYSEDSKETLDAFLLRANNKYRISFPQLHLESASYLTTTNGLVLYRIPYVGTASVFTFRHSLYFQSTLFGDVNTEQVDLVLGPSRSLGTHDSIEHFCKSAIATMQSCLRRLRGPCYAFNESIANAIRLSLTTASSTLVHTPLSRTIREDITNGLTDPPVASTPELPYEQIVASIELVTEMLERTPSSFATLAESDIRNVILTALNNRFGTAVGEMFSCRGKTDIAIVDDGRAIFIAECKFWRGPKTVSTAIDQLLGYLAWRDKCAGLVLFTRDKAVSAVQDDAARCIASHHLFKRIGGHISQTPIYVLHHEGDPLQELQLALFIVPLKEC